MAAALTPPSGTRSDATGAAGAQFGEPAHAGQTATRSVWYRFTAPSNGWARFDTLDSDFDTVLAVYTGDPSTLDLTPVAATTDPGAGDTVRFTTRRR